MLITLIQKGTSLSFADKFLIFAVIERFVIEKHLNSLAFFRGEERAENENVTSEVQGQTFPLDIEEYLHCRGPGDDIQK